MVIEKNCLVEAITDLGLVEPDRLPEVSVLAERLPQLRDLGRQLIQQEVLSAFQVNQLLQGRGKQLLLGPYVLLERVGVGGMGEVFKARHRRLQRIAAVKVVNRERLSHVNARQRFRREAEVAAQLSHPNIIAVYDFGEEADTHYLAMEFIDGIDLGRLVVQTGPLPVALACDFIRQAALGLHHAHEQGFVHRDIKPQNLLVAPRGSPRPENPNSDRPTRSALGRRYVGGTVKILDMGLIRLQPERVEETELALTQKGVVIGTMDYLSPEQALNSHRVDRRADLYSLGCTLYHLLAGQPPFPGGMPLDKLLRHQTDQAASLCKARPDVPAELEEILRRMMAKKPDERPSTAAEVALDLLPFASKSPATAVVRRAKVAPTMPRNDFANLEPTRMLAGPGGTDTDTPSPRRRCQTRRMRTIGRRRWGWWLTGGIATLSVLIASAVILSKPAPQTRSGAKKELEAVDRLVDYIPPDTNAILHVQPKALLTAPIFRRGASASQGRLAPGVSGLFGVLGVEPTQDVDWIRFHFPSAAAGESTWLARGEFAPGKVSRGGVLSREPEPKGQAGVYHYQPLKGPSLYLGHRSPYLLVGAKRERILAGVDHSTTGKSAPPSAALLQLVKRADREQHVWLAVLCKPLGPVVRVTNEPFADAAIQKALKNASLIEGGMTCGANLDVRLRLQANDDASAKRFVETIQGLQSAYSVGLALTPKKDYDKRLWLTLVSRSKVSRTGLRIDVTGQVTPAMMK